MVHLCPRRLLLNLKFSFFSEWSYILCPPMDLIGWRLVNNFKHRCLSKVCNKQNSAEEIGQFHIQFVPGSLFQTSLYDEEQNILISRDFSVAVFCANENYLRISDHELVTYFGKCMISCCCSPKTGRSLIKLSCCTNQPKHLLPLPHLSGSFMKLQHQQMWCWQSYKRQCQLHVWWVSRLGFQRRKKEDQV